MLLGGTAASADAVEVRPVVVDREGVIDIEYRSGETHVGRSLDAAPAGVQLLSPESAIIPVSFRTQTQREGALEFGPVAIDQSQDGA